MKSKAKLIISIASIAMYAVLLIVTYIGYIKFLKVDVIFYSSLYASLISLTGFGILLFYFPAFSVLSAFEKAQQVIICGLIGYTFAISAPTVIDRSLSFYILEKLQQRGGGIQLDKFNHIFTTEFMREHRVVEIRLTEQQESGTIVIENGCVKLTRRGEGLATFSRYFRRNLLPKQRLLRGEYTAQLTDPFAESDISPDYLCK